MCCLHQHVHAYAKHQEAGAWLAESDMRPTIDQFYKNVPLPLRKKE